MALQFILFNAATMKKIVQVNTAALDFYSSADFIKTEKVCL
jgi:hypothetical protein